MQERSTTTLPGAHVHVPHIEQPPTTALDMQQLLKDAEAAARKSSTNPSKEQHDV